jgi:RNase P subunit RPR2
MNRKEKPVSQTVKDRVVMQQQIKEKFGVKAVAKAKRRLCAKCKVIGCFLLPITTDGRDCPYFKQREVEE